MNNVLHMQCDGGSRGNPGPSSCAAWFPQLQMGVSEFIPEATNNIAEYRGLILGLKWALAHKYESVAVKADSKLIVNQVKGVWAVKQAHLGALRDQVDALSVQFIRFSIEYVPREQNFEADRMCNEEMDKAEDSDPMRFLN